MRKIVLILLFIISAVASFAQTPIPFPGFKRNNPLDTYPLAYDSLQRGGYRVVADTFERNLIPSSAVRKEGMLVYSIAQASHYQLIGGVLNSNWVQVLQGGLYTGSNGITLTGNNFTLGGTLTGNTTINTAGLNFNLTNLISTDTNSFVLGLTSDGTIVKNGAGRVSFFLSPALTSTITFDGYDSLSLTGEDDPWLDYELYAKVGGVLGTNKWGPQNALLSDPNMDRNNHWLFNGFTLYQDSGKVILNTKANGTATDSSFFVRSGNMLVRGDGVTLFHNNSLIVEAGGTQILSNKYSSLATGAYARGYQQPYEIRRSWPVFVPAYGRNIGTLSTNDSITLGATIDSTGANAYIISGGAFTSRQTGVSTLKYYFEATGHLWMKDMPYSATVDSLVGWKNGKLTATLSSQFSGGGGSGTVTSVSGSGGTTGLTLTGGPITTSGTLTLGGTLTVANGGTGVATITGLVKGNGTSAFTAAVAGTDYQAPLTTTDDNLIKPTANTIATNTSFQTITYGATSTFTTASGINGKLTLTGNTTVAIPSPQNGKTYGIKIYQGGSGGYSVIVPGGSTLSLRTGVGDSTYAEGKYDGTNSSWQWYTDIPVGSSNVVTVTTSSTLTAPVNDNSLVEVNATSGAVALTLPAMTAGKSFEIKKMDATLNAVTFTTIEGAQSLTTQYSGVKIRYDGTNYLIVAMF